MKKVFNYKIFIHLFFILMCLTFVIPMMCVISVSLSSEQSIREFGYQLFPREATLEAYRYVFKNPTQLIDSYKLTIFTSLVGSAASVLVMSLIAYPLSRDDFYFKKPITFIIFFTMLFGGGLIPTYILNTQYLHLGDTIWIYLLPGLVSAWNIIIIRTFFQQLPHSLAESAKIDGAKELRIFFSIILPLSTPVIATMFFMILVGKWNDWNTSLIYIRNNKLYSLQYMLQKILREVEFLESLSKSAQMGVNVNMSKEVPTEPFRYAMVIVAAGPMLVVFPFFQKYFVGGLTIGSVKG